MEYIFAITEYDSNNVDNSFTAINGRKEHWMDLTLKTYEVRRISSNEPTVITPQVWEDNIAVIQSFIDIEAQRVYTQLLLEKTRMHEINYFHSYMRIGADETNETIAAQIKQNEDTLAFLKSYKP